MTALIIDTSFLILPFWTGFTRPRGDIRSSGRKKSSLLYIVFFSSFFLFFFLPFIYCMAYNVSRKGCFKCGNRASLPLSLSLLPLTHPPTRQSATLPRHVRHKNGYVTTAANQATNPQPVPNRGASPPSNATPAAASDTSKPNAQPYAYKAPIRNATCVPPFPSPQHTLK
jgi:hypothetical protein